jgi:hypothetical protein
MPSAATTGWCPVPTPRTGHAWVANDMHLGLQLPNTWYRAVSTGASHPPLRSRASPCPEAPEWWSGATATWPGDSRTATATGATWSSSGGRGTTRQLPTARMEGRLPFGRHLEVIRVKGQAPCNTRSGKQSGGPSWVRTGGRLTRPAVDGARCGGGEPRAVPHGGRAHAWTMRCAWRR